MESERKISAPFSISISDFELFVKNTEKNGEKSVSAPIQRFIKKYNESPEKYKEKNKKEGGR